MTEAETYIGSNEYNTMCEELQRVSEASQSESRTDLGFTDGSVLVLVSRQGADVRAEVREDDGNGSNPV